MLLSQESGVSGRYSTNAEFLATSIFLCHFYGMGNLAFLWHFALFFSNFIHGISKSYLQRI